MRNVLCFLLLVVLVISCKSKLPTTPAVTDADIELYDQQVVAVPDSVRAPDGTKVAVTDSVKSVNWQGEILNRSQFIVDVALKLQLTVPPDTTAFYTSTEKLVEVAQNSILPFAYSETKAMTPQPVLRPGWTWRIKSRLVRFHK